MAIGQQFVVPLCSKVSLFQQPIKQDIGVGLIGSNVLNQMSSNFRGEVLYFGVGELGVTLKCNDCL